MSLTQKLPEHVIEDVISKAIDLTQYRGWQMSLRLVNRKDYDRSCLVSTDMFYVMQEVSTKRCFVFSICKRGLQLHVKAILLTVPSRPATLTASANSVEVMRILERKELTQDASIFKASLPSESHSNERI